MGTLPFVSDTFGPGHWREVVGSDLHDPAYHWGISHGREIDGHPLGGDLLVVHIAFDRPDICSAFRPGVVDELYRCLDHARVASNVAAVILTGNGSGVKDGGYSSCSGDDQRVRGSDGYCYEVEGANADMDLQTRHEQVDPTRVGRLHAFEVQRLIRIISKVVIAVAPRWATGRGHSLNVVCGLLIASKEHAVFMQTDASVGSFDAGYGSTLLARQVGDKRAREILFPTGHYDVDTAERWGVVNTSVPRAQLEDTALEWAKTTARKSPQATRLLKFVSNLADDGMAGQQVSMGGATYMAYATSEAQKGRDTFPGYRGPNWNTHPCYF